MKKKFSVASLFAGCGGLDRGFVQAGFKLTWANEYDKTIWETFQANHPGTILDKRSIRDIPSDEIPDADGIIGGPPCQSWSLAGAMRGAKDPRGQLFFEYIRVLNDKKPLFFLAENVAGIISSAHRAEFEKILVRFEEVGYNVSYKLLNAKDYGVPQERQRVIVVGFSDKLKASFAFPRRTHGAPQSIGRVDELFDAQERLQPYATLEDAIGDLPEACPSAPKNYGNGSLVVPNHEYMTGGFSTIYMSRNRKKEWHEASFTIQAGGRHAPLHPSASPMIKIGTDEWKFDPCSPVPYRRLSVRECARIQTFPDDFVFKYASVADGYKMIGNAVPVLLAEALAFTIKTQLLSHLSAKHSKSSAKAAKRARRNKR